MKFTFVVLAVLLLNTTAASAISQRDFDAITENTIYYDPEDTLVNVCSSSVVGTVSTADIPQEARDRFEQHKPKIDALRNEYIAAEQRNGVPWQMLAAVHYRERGNDPNSSPLAGEPFGTQNPDHPNITVNNMAEGLDYSSGFLRDLASTFYDVEITNNNTFEELQKIFVAYNRGSLYVRAGVSPDRSPYVMNFFDADHMNMMWVPGADTVSGTDANLGAMVIYALLLDDVASGGGCVGGGIGSAPGGITFPLATTKSYFFSPEYSSALTPITCSSPQPGGCHHDYFAADFGGIPGQTPVVAAMSGTVVRAVDVAFCDPSSNETKFKVPRVMILGDDNLYYYYTHMQPGSIRVSVGQTVAQATPLGLVGPSECAEGTPPHLHFDITTQQSVSRTRENSLNGLILDPMPALQEAFEFLPE